MLVFGKMLETCKFWDMKYEVCKYANVQICGRYASMHAFPFPLFFCDFISEAPEIRAAEVAIMWIIQWSHKPIFKFIDQLPKKLRISKDALKICIILSRLRSHFFCDRSKKKTPFVENICEVSDQLNYGSHMHNVQYTNKNVFGNFTWLVDVLIRITEKDVLQSFLVCTSSLFFF